MVAQSLLRVSCLLVSIIQTTSFQFFQTARSSCYTSHSYLQMVAYPTKIRNVVTKMTESTQKALQKMNSRMEIELPPGADFGVETSGKQASKQNNQISKEADPVKKSNREAARLVAEMFSMLSSTSVALFPSENEANNARIKWGSTFKGQVFSIDSQLGGKGAGDLYSKRRSVQEQEQSLLGTDGIYIPEGTQLVIIAGPRAKDIRKIRKIHERLGEETLIIIINGRASIAAASTRTKTTAAADGETETDHLDWLTQFFTPVFHYAPPFDYQSKPASSVTQRELLLYHEFDGDWYMAEKEANDGIFGTGINLPGSSGFKTIWEGKSRPVISELADLMNSAK